MLAKRTTRNQITLPEAAGLSWSESLNICFKASNKNGTMPTGIAAALQAGVPEGMSAKVQLIPVGGLAAGTACLEMDVSDIKKNDGSFFKAKK